MQKRTYKYDTIYQIENLDKTYALIDNSNWVSEKTIPLAQLLKIINSDNINNVKCFKFPNDILVPPDKCEPIDTISIALDEDKSNIYFWINNAWRKCILLDG